MTAYWHTSTSIRGRIFVSANMSWFKVQAVPEVVFAYPRGVRVPQVKAHCSSASRWTRTIRISVKVTRRRTVDELDGIVQEAVVAH
jgi:hypothetical protein